MPQLHVEFVNSKGDDLAVVNAARVSFGRDSSYDETGKLRPADISLLRFLANGMSSDEMAVLADEIVACRNPAEALTLVRRIRRIKSHEQPFAHVSIGMKVRAPLSIARQLWKSHVGAASTETGLWAWSEESGRYISKARECFSPDEWRSRSPDKKQGSGAPISDQLAADMALSSAVEAANAAYAELLRLGVAPEQARFVLPQGMMTAWYWSGTLLFFARVCQLRMDTHAQAEAQEIASMISDICAKVAPASWEALL